MSDSKLKEKAATQLACIEGSSDPRLLDLEPGDLLTLHDKGGEGAKSMVDTESFASVQRVLGRVCEAGDGRDDFTRGFDGIVAHGKRWAGIDPTADGSGAMSLPELERLVGATVPENRGFNPLVTAAYDKAKSLMVDCTRKMRDETTVDHMVHGLETACAGFTSVSTELAAVSAESGPEGPVVVGAIEAGCIVPPLAAAEIDARKASDLLAYRRALGNQLSCDQTADLIKEENRLGEHLPDQLMAAAFAAAGSVSDVITALRAAKNAKEAETVLKALSEGESVAKAAQIEKSVAEARAALKSAGGYDAKVVDAMSAEDVKALDTYDEKLKALESRLKDDPEALKRLEENKQLLRKRLSSALDGCAVGGAP